MKPTRPEFLIGVMLSAGTLAAFWPLFQNGFVNYEDTLYVSQNPHVLSGLSWGNVGWAFSTAYYDYWHPLAWISHMLDMDLFGLNPGWHHLTSLVFHVANTLLLFWVLRQMTGAVWRSGFVAALFAVHPLHVESVAWLTERKDLLSTFFFMLTLWAYARYTEEPEVSSQSFVFNAPRAKGHTTRFYLLSLICFALGLMSKPMLVTLPCVLLLLDY